MKLIMLGPPGSGKGTYASRMKPKLGIPHISTGDLFIGEIKKGTELGEEAKKYMEEGNLVPDNLTIEILEKRLEENDAKNGFILDGYPRTLPQAEALYKVTTIDKVLNLHLPEDILIEKISARRVCKECGDIYNIADIKRGDLHLPPMLPKKEGKCDKCDGDLYQRKDDAVEVVKERLEVYKRQTAPLINYYREKGVLVDIEVTAGPEVMVEKILKALNE